MDADGGGSFFLTTKHTKGGCCTERGERRRSFQPRRVLRDAKGWRRRWFIGRSCSGRVSGRGRGRRGLRTRSGAGAATPGEAGPGGGGGVIGGKGGRG